ncbi:hypothetical protein [Lactococcus formosensis]|uniref:Uncharacterized protein n=1 Tax=Lactococcus formosensis TaxID=1281486 RepID=A0A9Q9D6P1_9LACT|nr:hypothetical protein [Lactococcus formosensis]USJ20199.1 hypothetical protein LMK00_10345 [Lactococcus formosensis]
MTKVEKDIPIKHIFQDGRVIMGSTLHGSPGLREVCIPDEHKIYRVFARINRERMKEELGNNQKEK